MEYDGQKGAVEDINELIYSTLDSVRVIYSGGLSVLEKHLLNYSI